MFPPEAPKMTARKPRHAHDASGMALMIVLVMLSLLLGLAIMFLGRANTEFTSSVNHEAAERAEALAEQATRLVQAQIHHASTASSSSQPLPWASQPGMVKTFDSDSGTLLNAFKLYSSSAMITDAAGYQASVAEDQNYNTTPGLFTDLNLPIKSENDLRYPIVHPGALGSTGVSGVDGFDIVTPPSGFSPTNPGAPMPVRWLYVLEQGAIVAPVLSGTSVTIPGATKANPVVGRIAFWTDDESSKLNVNTAAHGTYWDIPRAHTRSERDGFSRFQPALNEFQRYPGHPATTSLFPVFGPLLGLTLDSATHEPSASFMEFLHGNGTATGILPRISGGGSAQGTATATAPLTIPSDRLYSSIDELIFRPDRAEQRGSGALTLTRDTVERGKFFLTTSSRAPELNLFHQPRIAIWPINVAPKRPSTIDSLIAFCSTFNNVPYYVQRSSPDNVSSDFQANLSLYNYIRGSMGKAIPGFGTTTFDTKMGADAPQVALQMLDYIRGANLMNEEFGASPFPNLVASAQFPSFKTAGAGVQGGTRYGQVTPLHGPGGKGFGRLPTLNKAILHFFIDDIAKASNGTSLLPAKPYPAYGKATPLMTNTIALDRSNLVDGDKLALTTRACLYFDMFDPMLGYPLANYNFDIRVTLSGNWEVTNLNGDVHPLNIPSSTLAVRNGMRFGWDHTYANGPTTGSDALVQKQVYAGTPFGGSRSSTWVLGNYRSIDYNHTGQNTLYPLISRPVRIHPEIAVTKQSNEIVLPDPPIPGGAAGDPAFASTFDFSGGTANVEIVVDGQVVQSFNLKFPAFTKPVPAWAQKGANQLKQISIDANFHNRISSYPASGPGYGKADVLLLQPGDTVVSLEPAYGDPRLIAGKTSLTTDTRTNFVAGSRANGDFAPHSAYGVATDRHAFEGRMDAMNRQPSWRAGRTRYGSFIPSLVYGPNAQPDLPSRYTGGVSVFSADGSTASFLPDFDNGCGFMQDGAYVNRADEGASYDDVAGGDMRASWFFASNSGELTLDQTFYSPSKQLPSAAMFGSLPVGVHRGLPWTTLLFRPNPGGGHPGAASPPDHLLLDLFWMPVVQPYAISERFSTAGKVNLNYEVMPFKHIKRATAIHGLLLSERIRAVRNVDLINGAQDRYKLPDSLGAVAASGVPMTYPINIPETLKGFEQRFAGGNLFISESEICTLPLIPEDLPAQTWAADFASNSAWWNARRATGANLRHRPYVSLLPRVTTRSNTYTVYVKAQALQVPKSLLPDSSSTPLTWNEKRASITGEHRGSTTIERFINPNAVVPDYLTPNASHPTLDTFYRWRVLNSNRFMP